jgi:hypothetical protein
MGLMVQEGEANTGDQEVVISTGERRAVLNSSQENAYRKTPLCTCYTVN